jgi:hypothetical protein
MLTTAIFFGDGLILRKRMVRRAADIMPSRLLMQGGSISRLLVMASEFMTKHYLRQDSAHSYSYCFR